MRIAWTKIVEMVIHRSGEAVPDGFHKTVRVHWECPSNKRTADGCRFWTFGPKGVRILDAADGKMIGNIPNTLICGHDEDGKPEDCGFRDATFADRYVMATNYYSSKSYVEVTGPVRRSTESARKKVLLSLRLCTARS